jgi:NADH-quinone oxidoreductase subunit N
MTEFPSISWNLLLPQMVLLSAALFLLLLAVIYRAGNSSRGPSTAGAILSLLGLGVATFMTYAQCETVAGTFGGMLRIDPFSTYFNILIMGGAALCVLLSVREAGRLKAVAGEYYALLVFSVLGMVVMVSAADLLVIFIGLETMSLAVYILVGIGRDSENGAEGALKYFLIGAFASAFMIYGIALLLGITGSTRLDVIASGLNLADGGALQLVAVSLVLVGFLFKIAAVPFHMWAPDAYQGAPTPITAFMAVAVKAAAFAVLLRVLNVSLLPLADYWLPVMWTLAVLTMTVGNLAAIFQGNIKRMLAYSSIAHAGYLLVALASIDPAAGVEDPAVAAVLFYLAVYTLMNVGAFGVIIYLGSGGRQMETLEQVKGAGFRYPILGVAMAVFMFSLAGIPPTGGFLGKFYVFSSAINRGLISLAIIGVLNSAASAYYYIRVTVQMYMRESDEQLPALPFSLPLAAALLIALYGVLHLGILPSDLLAVADRAVLFLR